MEPYDSWAFVATAIQWLLLAMTIAPAAVTIAWGLWEGFIRPGFVPADEIERPAADFAALYGAGAEEVAVLEEQRAGWRCETFERAKWRRVRCRLQARHDLQAK